MAALTSASGFITIVVLEGRNLVAKDSNGKSDPYVRYGIVGDDGSFEERRFRTNTAMKTLNPEWKKKKNELEVPERGCRIRFMVYDQDTGSGDDFMGECFVDVPCTGEDWTAWYELKPREGKSDRVSGEVKISFSYTWGTKVKLATNRITEVSKRSGALFRCGSLALALRGKEFKKGKFQCQISTSDGQVLKTGYKDANDEGERNWGEMILGLFQGCFPKRLSIIVKEKSFTGKNTLGSVTFDLPEEPTDELNVHLEGGIIQGAPTITRTGRVLAPGASRRRAIVTIHRANSLKAADKNGTSDPYVKLTLSQHSKVKQKTRIIKKDLNPIWDQKLILPEIGLHEQILFSVYDYDRGLGKDDFLGEYEYEVLDFDDVPETFLPLCARLGKSDENITGSLSVSIQFEELPSNPEVDIFGKTIKVKGRIAASITYELRDSACKSTIVTPRFGPVLRACSAQPFDAARVSEWNTFYPEAKSYCYILVGGLFTEHYPGYFSNNLKRMQELGLTVVKSNIDTDAGVKTNSAVLKKEIEDEYEKHQLPVVLFGHSKGGVDIAVTLQKHASLHPMIGGVIAVQAPWGGTPLIDWVLSSGARKALVNAWVKVAWRGEAAAVADLGLKRRVEFNQKHPYPTQIPTLCLCSWSDFSTLGSSMADMGGNSMAGSAKRTENLFGFRSDGMVVPQDARIPESDTILLTDMHHVEPATQLSGTRYHTGPLTQALVSLLFEKIRRERHATKRE
mmetsp:Transcript_8702/g.27015  ORF Transcript_8702/g.27015 Transcript_8702/m.27015 type:complete len:737 (+) Transcript_8702:145-2355(+)